MIRLFLAALAKDVKLLTRDRAGLAVIFAMPLALVFIVTLVQDNVMKTTGAGSARVLVFDREEGAAGRFVRDMLTQGGAFAVTVLPPEAGAEARARRRVLAGEAQLLVVVPEGLDEALTEAAAVSARRSLRRPDGAEDAGATATVPPLRVLYDPAVQGAFQTGVEATLARAVAAYSLRLRAKALKEYFRQGLREAMAEAMRETAGELPPEAFDGLPELTLDEGPLLEVAVEDLVTARPTAVQQNVPAWSLFGIFFIVVPLSGALVRERKDGLLARLITTPAPLGPVVAGKVAAYFLICLTQFALMLGVGRWVLPLFGTDPLAVHGPALPVAGVALAASFAAAGYGMAVGAWAKTFEQASMFGAVSVVIGAAVGGLMVPSYVMPPAMRAVHGFSPLAWGHGALVDLFVRQGDFAGVADRVGLLVAFGLGCLALAALSLQRRGGAVD